MTRLLLLGLNHTTAPLGVRERLAFAPARQREAIGQLRHRYPDCEVVLLSTCNRVEIYACRALHGQPKIEQLVEYLSEFHQVPADLFKAHLYERSERQAVEHLFTVTSSLDSMVLGETQILGQVRQAYDVARDLGATGALLNPLFQRAIAVGKEVMHATPLGEGRASVSSVAVGYAQRIFDHFGDKTVLCVGAGKMTMLALRAFAQLHPRQMIIANRDRDKAEALAAEFGGSGVSLSALEQQLVAADIVITCTAAAQPILTRRQFAGLLKQRRYRPIFIIDIAVPRDVEPAVGELDHVYLYNLDDLQQAVAQTHAQRGQALDAARAIVNRQVDEFIAWQRQRELGPAIDRLYRRFHEMAAEEVQRTLNKLPRAGEQERAQLEDLARRIVNKLLHDPIRTLRQGDSLHAPGAQYLHAVVKMFHLEAQDAEGNAASEPSPRDANEQRDAG